MSYNPGRSRIEAEDHAVRELTLFAENESSLYNQRQSIQKNLLRKLRKGIYDRSLAWKPWKDWFDRAAKEYVAQFGSPGAKLFSVGDREQAAKSFAIEEERALRAGEYDYLLPKKNPARPPKGTKAYVNRRSEATKKRPTKRLRKRRTRNRVKRTFPNPSKLGFGLYARKGSGPRMHFDGVKFSTNGLPKLFDSASLAQHESEHLMLRYPILKGYRVTVEPTRGK